MSDPWGVASLVLGIVSMVSLLLCLCGGYWVAAPLAFAGVLTGVFGRGGYRVAGLILNGLVLIPGIAALVMGATLIAILFGASHAQPTNKHSGVEKTGTGTRQGPPVVPVVSGTGVDPPKPLPPTTPGTLQLDIPKLSGNRRNLELFVDGQLDEGFAQLLNQFRPIDTHTVRLTPGDRTVVLKKTGSKCTRRPSRSRSRPTGPRSCPSTWW
ncbi:MAG: hypothetical protein JWO38_1620 [Gemmataceae bacterium]|nr:hypothetical protein [Gemmataceae bacterium]